MSYDEKILLRAELAVAVERANEAAKEINRARESGDAARIRLAMSTYSTADDAITKIKRRQAQLEHGLA